MTDNKSFSGFFSRKPKHDSITSVPRSEGGGSVAKDDCCDGAVDEALQELNTKERAKSVRFPDGQDSKPFFRMRRRKKASSVSKGEDSDTKSQTERTLSFDQPRLSSSFSRIPFEGLFRPSISPRTSTMSVTGTPAVTSMAIMAASNSLAAQGSPRVESPGFTERHSLSRQNSTRSVRSLRSSRSTPISDRSQVQENEDNKIVNTRGRSLTYSSADTQAKAGSSGRSSKFFAMNLLRRDVEDGSLFRPLSRDKSPHVASLISTRRIEPDPATTLPIPIQGESAYQFLARLEAKIPKTMIASLLATSGDSLFHDCLQLYMQNFDFVDDPLDMSLRKLLMDTHLPKETQQIDRVLNAFSERYQTCNPRLYDSQVTPYILSFALIMLHTDRFNQNNKNKMTKAQFIRNTTSEHTSKVNSHVLEYFYDNIISTPFILVEDENDPHSADRSDPPTPNEVLTQQSVGRPGAVSAMSQNGNYFGKRNMDLYPLIMENRLDTLRPQLNSILTFEHTLSYTGTLPVLNVAKLHSAFIHPATLQLVSARSRPEAFVTDESTVNPQDTDPGLVDIQISKIGILKRKEQKKANSKPIYREWGVMLTPSQLLLFKNVGWVKLYLQQAKEKSKDKTIVLSPPVHNYSPDTYLPTSDTVAMYDASINKKSTHFCFYGRGGQQTYLMASSEEEMNDWVAKINYAAAFQTVGVRIRGTEALGEAQNTSIRRMTRHASTSSQGTISGSLASNHEIILARQNVLHNKVHEIAQKMKDKEDQLNLLQQHARNLCTLTPIQPRTRSQIISAAGTLSAQIRWTKMELCKTQCHHDILAKDLELETLPAAKAFTAPLRPTTPSTDSSATLKTSPSKSKLSSVFRQVSTDTIKRVNRQFSTSEIKRGASMIVGSSAGQHGRSESEYSIPNVDLTPESLSHLFSNSPERNVHNSETISLRQTLDLVPRQASPGLSDQERSKAPTGLKLNLSMISRKPSTRSKIDRDEESGAGDGSDVVSPSPSGRESGHFLLHGRKVSVVQTPSNLQRRRSPPISEAGLATDRSPGNPSRPLIKASLDGDHEQVVLSPDPSI